MIDPAEEHFCKLLAKDIKPEGAAIEAFALRTMHVAEERAQEMMAQARIIDRVSWLKAAFKDLETKFLSLEEKRHFLAAVVRTPIGSISEASELCAEYIVQVDNDGRVTTKVKALNKLEAIKIDAILAKEWEELLTLKHDAEKPLQIRVIQFSNNPVEARRAWQDTLKIAPPPLTIDVESEKIANEKANINK